MDKLGDIPTVEQAALVVGRAEASSSRVGK
jgi:hypothetical protein